MSFVRVGRSQPQTKGKRTVRPKKAAATKKEWVSTTSDLSVHKLTPAELNYRHEIHKSHNTAAAQWELREKALKRRLRHPGSPAPLDKASLSIIREVFSDQLLLQDVLARSDRAMAVVKDLFGDAPRRQTGHPSVTMAPHCGSDSTLPVLQLPDPPTQLSLLSQSMMDKQALNEVESPEACSDEDNSPDGSSACDVIRRANVQKMKALSQARATQEVHHLNSDKVERDIIPVTPCSSGRAPALNATVAIQRAQSRLSQPHEGKEEPFVLVSQALNPGLSSSQPGGNSRCNRRTRKCASQSLKLDGSCVASQSGDQSSLGLLQDMLSQVEADLDLLSESPKADSAKSQKQSSSQSLTGFSVALVSTLGRLVHLFKQKEEEAQVEALERRRLEEELKGQRALIDALTAETMNLREEAAALQAGLLQQTAELEQRLDTVVLVMGELGLLKTSTDPLEDSNVKAAALQSAPAAVKHMESIQPSVSPAVLLSPPRQRNNWHRNSGNSQECSFEALSSASSLTSLPLISLPPTSSSTLALNALHSQLSPEAMLAEIAQLSEQNNLIKAQLSQAGSRVAGSSRNSNGERLFSPGSADRVTPTGAGERRVSASSSTGRRSRHSLTPEGVQQISQGTSPTSLCARSVEQRLLVLNRQSAAARGRLLELIEQQKPSDSPSGSPIPPSAISPQSAGGPDLSMLLAAQEHLSHTRAMSRQSAGSQVSSYSLGGQTKDDRMEVGKRREREGWFALSSHVR
ncbi:spindle and centriole-associated protein 1 isoform X2 [Halichoeres trimaculatus]|uniref:spindle and centriole-associated protein 1 isoform X2 n=1 Tax=Halichoeres trimaculatus TaxID=147232 RepID=UPI003D9E9B85